MVVIHNGIPADVQRDSKVCRETTLEQWGVRAHNSVIVVPGRLVPEKGHEVLVRALVELRSGGLAPDVLIIGDGPLRAKIQSIVRQSSLQEQVRMIPAMSQPRLFRVIQSADIFLLPSLQEGFGLAPAEAMKLGTPVIATRVGGLPELIEEGVSGILVPPGDHLALAAAMKGALTSPEFRERLRREAFDRIGRFTARKAATAMETMYEALLARG